MIFLVTRVYPCEEDTDIYTYIYGYNIMCFQCLRNDYLMVAKKPTQYSLHKTHNYR